MDKFSFGIYNITTVLVDTFCCCPCIVNDAEPMLQLRDCLQCLCKADDQATAGYVGGGGKVQQHMCRMHSKVMHFPICSSPSVQACVSIGRPPANAAQISAIVGLVTGCSCSTGMLQSWCDRRCKLGVRAREATAESKATAHS